MALSHYPNISAQTTLKDGTTYAYAFKKPVGGKPTFLLLHGFPSSSYDWRRQVDYLADKGFGFLVPDLLGFGDTDSPHEVQAYSFKRISDHVAEIMSKLGLGSGVIGVGHDWGSALLARFYNWHPEYLRALIFTSVGYNAPSDTPLDVDSINQMTEKLFGYPTYGYWKFFEREDAGNIINKHTESFTSLLYPANPETWRTHMAPVGAAEAWITSDTKTSLPAWLSQEEVDAHNRVMAQNGYIGPTNWYKSAIQNVDGPLHAKLPEERKKITLPTMLVVSDKDCVTRAEMSKDTTSKWVQNLRIEELSCGHWIQLEQTDKYNKLLESFAMGLSE